MDFADLVNRRFSLRKYSTVPVPDELIEQCLEAARLAPSACNSQPWTFLVARTPEKTEPLAKAAFSGIYSMNSFASQAPVLITVITERSRYSASLGGLFRGVRFSLMDVAIACEHIALQAAELGLGTCMYGWFDEKAARRELGLPSGAKIDIMLSLGYPAEGVTVPRKNRKTLDEIRKYI